MLLSTLNRKDKLKFLDLALHMVVVDGAPSDLEQRLLNMMLAEVGDNIMSEYTFTLSDSLEQTIQYFDVLSPRIQRIVYLNLIRISLSEEIYNATEHDFLEMIRARFHIKDDVKQKIIKAVFEEKDLREAINKIVGK